MNARPLDYVSSDDARRGRQWRWLASRFARWHAWVAGFFWLAFSGLTLLILTSAADASARRPATLALTTAGTLLGPMTGAITRDFQGCCLEFSLALLPWCGGALLAAVAVQLFVPPSGRPLRVLRALAWAAGLFAWFAGGIVSFGHALS